MALSIDSITLIQSAIFTQNPTLSSALSSGFASEFSSSSLALFGVSKGALNRQTATLATQTSIQTAIDDLGSLQSKLKTLGTAAASLRPVASSFGSDIDVDTARKDDDTVGLSADQTSSLKTGDKIIFQTSFGVVEADFPYFVNRGSDSGSNTEFKLFLTRSDALNDTNAVDIQDNETGLGLKANQHIPQVEEGITSLIAAFNDVQDFLAEKTAKGGSLQNFGEFSRLKTALSSAVVPVFGHGDLSSVFTGSRADRTITVNSTALESQASAEAQSIASFLEENDGVAHNVQKITSDFLGRGGIVGEIIAAREDRITNLGSQLDSVNRLIEKQRAAGLRNLRISRSHCHQSPTRLSTGPRRLDRAQSSC